MPNTRYQFTVSLSTDGSVMIDPSIPEDKAADIEREATALDIIDTSRKLIADLERNMVLDAVNQMVSALIPPAEVTPSEKVSEALKKRTAKAE